MHNQNKKIVLLLPRWMNSIKADSDFIVRCGTLKPEDYNSDVIVGLSLGALIALRESKNIIGKIILVNPLLPKRALYIWFLRWVNFIFSEGLRIRENKFTKNPIRFVFGCVDCFCLLRSDFSEVFLGELEKRIVIIRGGGDRFFYDEKAVEFCKLVAVPVVTVEKSGHNWTREIECEVMRVISSL